jgi:hypothetical protein
VAMHGFIRALWLSFGHLACFLVPALHRRTERGSQYSLGGGDISAPWNDAACLIFNKSCSWLGRNVELRTKWATWHVIDRLQS